MKAKVEIELPDEAVVLERFVAVLYISSNGGMGISISSPDPGKLHSTIGMLELAKDQLIQGSGWRTDMEDE